jgi:hypothetical protein
MPNIDILQNTPQNGTPHTASIPLPGTTPVWKLKLSVSHARFLWSVWKRDPIYKVLQEATREELLFIANAVGLGFKEQFFMFHEIFNTLNRLATSTKYNQLFKHTIGSLYKFHPFRGDIHVVFENTFGESNRQVEIL